MAEPAPSRPFRRFLGCCRGEHVANTHCPYPGLPSASCGITTALPEMLCTNALTSGESHFEISSLPWLLQLTQVELFHRLIQLDWERRVPSSSLTLRTNGGTDAKTPLPAIALQCAPCSPFTRAEESATGDWGHSPTGTTGHVRHLWFLRCFLLPYPGHQHLPQMRSARNCQRLARKVITP